jgi:prevent-host-death family protein
MKSIGVRELRQRASEYLREVEAGETVEITSRGRPVALLVPVPPVGRRATLIAQGRMRPARGNLLELGDPLEPIPGQPSPSEVLAAMREHER